MFMTLDAKPITLAFTILPLSYIGETSICLWESMNFVQATSCW